MYNQLRTMNRANMMILSVGHLHLLRRVWDHRGRDEVVNIHYLLQKLKWLIILIILNRMYIVYWHITAAKILIIFLNVNISNI